MISSEQIRRIAREEKLAAGVVEKDYALTWLLKGIYLMGSGLDDKFVLKGGTAIRKVYFPQTWRFSEDLDFTVAGAMKPEGIKESIQRVLKTLFQESGINYSLESFHSTEGSVTAEVQYVGPLNFTNRIKHDISLSEKMVLEPERRPVRTIYSDLHEFDLVVYSLNEILVEKIRSIIQRGYSRDYYDVWRLLRGNGFRDSDIKRLLKRKCELNGVKCEPSLLFDEKRLSEAQSYWEKGLQYLTKELPRFEVVISEMKGKLSFLQE
ncbi:MAG: nucleotidyl transferase AbiEii/AbiGii toxin family protein [Candidatus Atabeyarchaeum deiterrae]